MIDIIRIIISVILAIAIFSSPGSSEQKEIVNDQNLEIVETLPSDDINDVQIDIKYSVESFKDAFFSFPDNEVNGSDNDNVAQNDANESTSNQNTSNNNSNPNNNNNTTDSSNPGNAQIPPPTSNNVTTPAVGGNTGSEETPGQKPSENTTPNTTQPTTTPTTPPTPQNPSDDEHDDYDPTSGEYAGDTAVPDDVYDVPVSCTSHDMKFKSSSVNSEYELFKYVTNVYQCSQCSYKESFVEIESQNLSKAELRNISAKVVDQVNYLRANNGLNTLTTSSEWNSWAVMRAKELSQLYGHARPNGQSWMTAIGSSYTMAENVASGQASGMDFFSAFKNSSSHRANMLCKDASMIAVGIYVSENGTTYCAMIVVAE